MRKTRLIVQCVIAGIDLVEPIMQADVRMEACWSLEELDRTVRSMSSMLKRRGEGWRREKWKANDRVM